jgi:hypothetical protein
MTLNRVWMFFVLVSFLAVLFVVPVNAADKVVVIPLVDKVTVTVQTPVEPFEPVAADSPPNSDYTIGTDTVTDNVTGLVWQKGSSATQMDWDDAWDYCTDNSAGLPGTGWRLPSIGELMSIVYYGTYNPAINGTAFTGTNASHYWSATTYANSSGYAWYVNFYRGLVYFNVKSGTLYVRCVR